MKNLKIELHLLQNFPPSCLNRDDTNTPKTCEFGGVTRARVSSQCWKRAVREYFKAEAPERRGIRSKRLKSELINALVQANKGQEAAG
jgi:CRISPR system Cascade subunit CasC